MVYYTVNIALMEDRQSLMWNRFYIFPYGLCVPSGLCGETITAKLAMSAKRYYNLQFFML